MRCTSIFNFSSSWWLSRKSESAVLLREKIGILFEHRNSKSRKLPSLSSAEETKSAWTLEEVALNATIVKSELDSSSTFQETSIPSFQMISSLLDEIEVHDLQRILELVTKDASSIPLLNLQEKESAIFTS